MKAKYINELAAEDFLKPKSKDDIINDYHNLSIIQQIEFLDNSDFGDKIPENLKPLIIRIRNEMDNNINVFSNFDITNIENVSYQVSKLESMVDIGVLFKIKSLFNKNIPYIIIEQLYKEPYVRAYIKTINNEKSKYFKFTSADDIWLWMMRIGYKEVLKR